MEVSPELGVAFEAPTNSSSADIYGMSPGSSPRGSTTSFQSGPGSSAFHGSPRPDGEEEGNRQSSRSKHGSSSARAQSPDGSDKRKRAATERDRKKVSPLVKRLGEDALFMLPHPSRSDNTSQMYPGVVIGSFAGKDQDSSLGFGMDEMRFDGSMDDILDRSAANLPQARHDSTGGAAGANIAPWLMEDSPARPEPQRVAVEQAAMQGESRDLPRKASMQALSHFASVPSLPRMKRQGTVAPVLEVPSGSSSRNGSQPSITPLYGSAAPASSSSSSKEESRSRHGSDDSMQTLGAHQGKKKGSSGSSPSGEPAPLPQLAKHSIAQQGNRMRFGSTASSMTAPNIAAEKKKGFLGGFLRRNAKPLSSEAHSLGLRAWTDVGFRRYIL